MELITDSKRPLKMISANILNITLILINNVKETEIRVIFILS